MIMDKLKEWWHIQLSEISSRSTSISPFELMVGVNLKKKEDQDILKILEEERRDIFAEGKY